MLRDYADITGRLGDPIWFDENGAPRYEPFHPKMCGIYDHMVALLEIGCQSCRKSFKVSCEIEMTTVFTSKVQMPTEKNAGSFGYGDPPPCGHDGCGGVTMMSDTIRVIEFWIKNSDHEWERKPEYEVYIGENEEDE